MGIDKLMQGAAGWVVKPLQDGARALKQGLAMKPGQIGDKIEKVSNIAKPIVDQFEKRTGVKANLFERESAGLRSQQTDALARARKLEAQRAKPPRPLTKGTPGQRAKNRGARAEVNRTNQALQRAARQDVKRADQILEERLALQRAAGAERLKGAKLGKLSKGIGIAGEVGDAVDQYEKSPAQTRVGKLMDAGLNSALSNAQLRNPVVAAVDSATGGTIDDSISGESSVLVSSAEYMVTGDGRGPVEFREKSKEGEFGVAWKGVASVGDRAAEKTRKQQQMEEAAGSPPLGPLRELNRTARNANEAYVESVNELASGILRRLEGKR